MSMENTSDATIITRHEALVQYLYEEGIIPEGQTYVWKKHVAFGESDELVGKVVYGVLPMHLAALTREYVNVPLDIPPEMRGKELSIEEIRQFAKPVEHYEVRLVRRGCTDILSRRQG